MSLGPQIYFQTAADQDIYRWSRYLFASGDLSMWMIMDKGAIMDCQSIKSSAIDLPWNPVIRHSNFEEACNQQNDDQGACEGLPYCEWVPNHVQNHQQCVGESCNRDDRTVNCALKASEHSWNGMIAAQQYCRATCCPEDPVRSKQLFCDLEFSLLWVLRPGLI